MISFHLINKLKGGDEVFFYWRAGKGRRNIKALLGLVGGTTVSSVWHIKEEARDRESKTRKRTWRVGGVGWVFLGRALGEPS